MTARPEGAPERTIVNVPMKTVMPASESCESSASCTEEKTDGAEDCARVEIRTTWPAERLHVFIRDVERLLRINPHYEFDRFDWLDGHHRTQARMKGMNHANGQPFDVHLRVEETAEGLDLHWQGWLKPLTRIRIREESPRTAHLVIVDDYSPLPRQERERRRTEADTSLLAWAHALHRHLRWRPHLVRWPGLEPLIDRFWLRMKPAARRISAMLVMVTLAELFVFAVVFAIFWLEWRG